MKRWIPLIDFSTKYNISISTLRRRIREKSISYEIRDGKYFLPDEVLHKAQRGRKQISIDMAMGDKIFVEEEKDMTQALLDELKKAYSQVLTEKEEQIFQLKEEVTDLRTLVRVLEQELERVQQQAVDNHHQLMSI